MAGIFEFLSSRFRKPAEAVVPARATGPLNDDAFLAFISHELRTPLTAIIGYSEILQEDAVFLDQKDFLPDLKKIQMASEHLLALVDDIVDLSRVETSRMELAIEEFKPGTIVTEVAKDARVVVDRTFCTLETDIAPDLPSMKADRAKVRRGVSNLVRHAVGLASQGAIKLSVGLVNVGDQRRIRFAVHHPDLKMKSRDLKAIVDGASRSASGLPQYHGSGLGLVITERFCKLMGGDLSAEQADKGVVLAMTVPIEAPSVGVAEPPPQG
jgi:signal transduction histidine kinase